MAVTPEREPKPAVPEEVTERPVEVPPEVERAGAQAVPTQFTAQVTDDAGQQLIQAPATQVITIQIPAAQSQLEDWSHGSPADSLTWFALFWLRMIKKALHFGWRIITGGGGGK